MPVGIVRADRGGRGTVGRQAKHYNRRCTPLRPSFRLARRMDEPPQPAHRAHRVGMAIIAGPANHRNRHHAGNSPPVAPFVKISQIIQADEPDEPLARIAALQFLQGVDRISGAGAQFEVAGPDRSSSRHSPRRSEPGVIGRHILAALLERIARRDQPPYLVEAERTNGLKADPPVPAVGRIERTAEKADARHWRERLARAPRRA